MGIELMDENREIDEIIENNPFRQAVYSVIPDRARKILDFGCNKGELLLRLKRDKNCKDLYGVEIDENCRGPLEKFLDGSWILNLDEEGADLGREFYHFFNYIIMHDVIEHLYDPWYVTAKLGNYLSPRGKLIMVTPNLQFWGLLNSILEGKFRRYLELHDYHVGLRGRQGMERRRLHERYHVRYQILQPIGETG